MWIFIGVVILIIGVAVLQHKHNESLKRNIITTQRNEQMHEEQNINRLKNQGYTLIPIKTIDTKYRGVTSTELREIITSAILRGEYTIAVHKDIIAEMDSKLRARKKRDKDFDTLMELQNNGKTLEELNSPEEAITEYEKCVDFGENSKLMTINNYSHSIERLAILYRKKKDYDKEVAVLNKALAHDMAASSKTKFEARLSKVIELQQKINNLQN